MYDNPFGVGTGERVELMTLGATWQNDLLLLAYLVTVVVAAWLVYKFVEDPTRSYSAKIAKKYQRRELVWSEAFATLFAPRRKSASE